MEKIDVIVDLYHHVPNLADLLGEIKPDSIVSRTVYRDDRIKVTLFGFAAGQELTEHTSTKAAIVQIVRGDAEMTLGDDTLEASVGTWIHMAPNLPHSLLAKSEVMMLLTIFK